MKGPSEFDPIPPQNSNPFIFPNNFIDLVLRLYDKGSKLIFPVDSCEYLTYI